jgi:hypothetical protein
LERIAKAVVLARGGGLLGLAMVIPPEHGLFGIRERHGTNNTKKRRPGTLTEETIEARYIL